MSSNMVKLIFGEKHYWCRVWKDFLPENQFYTERGWANSPDSPKRNVCIKAYNTPVWCEEQGKMITACGVEKFDDQVRLHHGLITEMPKKPSLVGLFK